jgi:pimeloyl-ACP methyl ester carboxylesterase
MAKSSDVILVHGAWADGSSWAKVIPLLAARGHSVTQSPTAGAALGGTVSAPAWRAKTCRYLVATNDRAIPPALQRRMAKRLNAAVVEVASSHVAMLSHPEEVASLIAG